MSTLSHDTGAIGAPTSAQTIPEALEAAAARGVTITFVDHALTATPLPCTALARGARRAAASLRALGVSQGDRVCLVSSTSVDFLVALFGAWRAGAIPVVVPLPRTLDGAADFGDEIVRRMHAADSQVVVLADLIADLAPWTDQLPGTVARCGELGTAGASEIGDPLPTDANAVAHLQFTSGTTSTPRAVTLRHGQVLSHAEAVLRGARVERDDYVWVSWLPWYHDMGILTGVGTLAVGDHLVLLPPEEFLRRPASWIEAVDRFRGVGTAAPNFAYALAARELEQRSQPLDLSCLAVAGNGAEAIDLGAVGHFRRVAAQHGLAENAMCPMYGLAEATLAVTMSLASEPFEVDVVSRRELERGIATPVDASDPDAREIARCGRPIPGVELAIRDVDGADLDDRQVGEIHVRSPWVTDGFWRDEEATAQTVVDGWLRTGDLGYVADGELVVCGRIKDMVIAAGRNLYPEDYEQTARQVTGVRPIVAAFAVQGAERMMVAVEAEREVEDAADLARRVFAQLHTVLAHSPEEVLVVPRGEIPRTSSGKVQRHGVRDRLDAGTLNVLGRASR